MNWKKGIGFGIFVWVAMFIAVSILIAYKMPQNMTFTIIVTIVSLLAAYFSARKIAPKTPIEAIKYGLAFAVVGLILDFIISKRFAPDIFSSASYWISYVLIMLVPSFTIKKISVPSQNPQ